MSRLTLYAASDATTPRATLTTPEDIAADLNGRGIRFERVSHPSIGGAVTDPQALLDTMADTIAELKQRYGYATADVVRVTTETPNHEAMRTKFLAEHTHAEDECRLMLEGGGSFFLHLGEEVLHVEVSAGDLLSVPAGAMHWFDMGAAPHFAALRLFTNPEGWVASFTGDAIASRFPAHGAQGGA